MAEQELDKLQVEIKRGTKTPSGAKAAVHLTLVADGKPVHFQQTAALKGPAPQWKQQFTFDVAGLRSPKLEIVLHNSQTGKAIGKDTVEVADLPLNRPLSSDVGVGSARVFLVLMPTGRARPIIRRNDSSSSDDSIGHALALPPLPVAVRPPAPLAAAPVSNHPAPTAAPTGPLLEVKVTSAKGFENLPKCQMGVEIRIGKWVAKTPPLPNQTVALFNCPLTVLLPEHAPPLALAVKDHETGLALGSGEIDLATLPWATSSVHMQSVLMLAGNVQAGTVSLLFRAADQAEMTAWARRQAFQVGAPVPPSRVPVPLLTERVSNHAAAHPRDGAELVRQDRASMPVARRLSAMEVVPRAPPGRMATAVTKPMPDAPPAPSPGSGRAHQVIDGTFHIRSMEFAIVGTDPAFWERPATLAAQVTLRGRAATVGRRTASAPKGPVVRWVDGLSFALTEAAPTAEVQLWERLDAGHQLIGRCSVPLPESDEDQHVKVMLRPTPLYAQLTITVLARYSVKYGQKFQPQATPTGPSVLPEWLLAQDQPPPEPPAPKPRRSASNPPPSDPTTPQTPAARAAMEVFAAPPENAVVAAHPRDVVPLHQRSRSSGGESRMKVVSFEKSMAVAASPGRSGVRPPYVDAARTKDSLRTLSGALAPVAFLLAAASQSPVFSAGLYFSVLYACYMTWVLQLLAAVLLAAVVGNNVVRAAVAHMPSADMRRIQHAALATEEQLVSLTAGAAQLSQFLARRRPTVGLALGGAALAATLLIPPYGVCLLAGTAALALVLPLPSEDVDTDLYVRTKPLAVLLPWYLITAWVDDGLMVVGAALFLVCFTHLPILRDYPSSASLHHLVCFFKAAATGVRRPFVGSLQIHVVDGRLKTKGANTGCFVMLTAEQGQLRYTRVVPGPTPQWDEAWEPVLVSNVAPCKLQVWEGTVGGTGEGHVLLGETTLTIRGPAEEAEKVVPLTGERGPCGELRLRLRVLPVAAEQAAVPLTAPRPLSLKPPRAH